ncbi:MAG: dihydropteroate synthase [Pseudomonadota bacterium]
MSKIHIVGILNVTPDSFYDGGKYTPRTQALIHARQMISDGATVIDIGGESTRPGAPSVSAEEEMARVLPIIESLVRETDVTISIDTVKPTVMRAAIAAGARMVNDVNALSAEGAVSCVAETGVQVCLNHMQGTPGTMQVEPYYDNVVQAVYDYLEARIQACVDAGISKQAILVDPGFGFGKTLAHNLSLLKHLSVFAQLSCPVYVGLSRKSMIGALLGGAPVQHRLIGSVSAAVIAAMHGAQYIRVHDVAATAQALAVVQGMIEAK